MRLFLITYDLKKEHTESSYSMLYDKIQSYGDVQHPLASVWVVAVDNLIDANMISANLRTVMDKNDFLLVIEISGTANRQGWLPKAFWDWMDKHALY